MNTIRIAFIIDHLDVGGTETQLYSLLRGLDKKQFEPQVICLKEKGRTAQQIENIGVPVLAMFPSKWVRPKLLNRIVLVLKLAKYLKKNQIKIIQNYLITSNILGTIAGKLAGVNVICASERGVTNTDNGDLSGRNKVFRSLLPWIDKVIGNSNLVVDYLRKSVNVPDDKLCCINNGINYRKYQEAPPSGLRTEFGLPDEAILIGVIGRLIVQKNHLLVFKVFKELTESYPNLFLMVVGDGCHKDKLVQMVTQFRLEAKIIFLGNRSEIPSILKDLDIVVQGSNFEGLPNVIMEAMSTAKPVVATDAGGTRELVIHNETGFLVPCKKENPLRKKLAHLINNPEDRLTMGFKGQQHIKQHFSGNQLINHTQNLYLHLLQKKNP